MKKKKLKLTKKERLRLASKAALLTKTYVSEEEYNSRLLDFLEYNDKLFRDKNGNWKTAMQEVKNMYYDAYNVYVHNTGRLPDVWGAYEALEESLYMMLDEFARLLKEHNEDFVATMQSYPGVATEEFDDASLAKHAQNLLFAQESEVDFDYDSLRLRGFITFVEDETGAAYVSNIVVDRDFRNEGIDKKLLSGLLEEFKIVTTEVWSIDEKRISLLKELGFIETDRMRDEICQGIDTVRFEYRRPAKAMH